MNKQGAGTDPKLLFVEYKGDMANPSPMISDERLTEYRAMMPSYEYQRCHLNEWVAGDQTFLKRAIIDNAVDPDLSNVWTGSDHGFFIGVDLGWQHDASAVAVVTKTQCPARSSSTI
jgi:hypothetical protein